MRVLFINQFYLPDYAATAQFLGDLAEDLTDDQIEVHVIAGTAQYTKQERETKANFNPGLVCVRRVQSTNFGRNSGLGLLGALFDYLTFYVGALWMAFRVPKPDIVITLSTPPLLSLIGLIIHRFRGTKFVYWIQDIYPDVGYIVGAFRPGGLAGRSIDFLNRLSLRHADRIVALGDRMAERLRQKGVADRKMAIVPHWADSDSLFPQDNSNEWRNELKLENVFIVQYSGNMGRGHEFETILHAAHQIQQSDCASFPLHLLFIGDGVQKVHIMNRIEELRLKNIHMLSYRPREALNESLNTSDVALISLQPGLDGHLVPSKLYAILAVGKPCLFIGPSQSEVARILKEHSCGIAIEPGDIDGCVKALLKYWNNPGLRRIHGQNARKLFEDQYQREQSTSKFRNILTDLTNVNRV